MISMNGSCFFAVCLFRHWTGYTVPGSIPKIPYVSRLLWDQNRSPMVKTFTEGKWPDRMVSHRGQYRQQRMPYAACPGKKCLYPLSSRQYAENPLHQQRVMVYAFRALMISGSSLSTTSLSSWQVPALACPPPP